MIAVTEPDTENDIAVEWAPLPGRSAQAWRDLVEGLKRYWM
jgi:hypothetical protein